MAVAVFIIIQITLRIMPIMMSLKTVIIKNGLTITYKKYVSDYKYKQSFRVLFLPVSLHDNDKSNCRKR